jgi:hypothetical protein
MPRNINIGGIYHTSKPSVEIAGAMHKDRFRSNNIGGVWRKSYSSGINPVVSSVYNLNEQDAFTTTGLATNVTSNGLDVYFGWSHRKTSSTSTGTDSFEFDINLDCQLPYAVDVSHYPGWEYLYTLLSAIPLTQTNDYLSGFVVSSIRMRELFYNSSSYWVNIGSDRVSDTSFPAESVNRGNYYDGNTMSNLRFTFGVQYSCSRTHVQHGNVAFTIPNSAFIIIPEIVNLPLVF